MFEVLIESSAVRPRVRGGVFASLAVHAALAAALVPLAGHSIVRGPLVIEWPWVDPPTLTWVHPDPTHVPVPPQTPLGPVCGCVFSRPNIQLPAVIIGDRRREIDGRSAEPGVSRPFRLRPLYFFERVATLRELTYPRYPDALRVAGVSGRVVLQFVIDTLGRIDPVSVSVLESTDPQFEAAVRTVLPQLRFTPAEIAKEKVPTVARLPFIFRNRRPKDI